MAETPNIHWDREGHAHTNALHWEGFPRLLWESLQIFGYDAPPLYDGHEFVEASVPRCRVKMTIPQHPSRYLWQPVTISMIGHRLVDTFESAAQQLRGTARIWWDHYSAMQPDGHVVSWEEFKAALRTHHIPEGLIECKLNEFLALT
jgi:hypothetical protein